MRVAEGDKKALTIMLRGNERRKTAGERQSWNGRTTTKGGSRRSAQFSASLSSFWWCVGARGFPAEFSDGLKEHDDCRDSSNMLTERYVKDPGSIRERNRKKVAKGGSIVRESGRTSTGERDF